MRRYLFALAALCFAALCVPAQAQLAAQSLALANQCPLTLGINVSRDCPTVVIPNTTTYQQDVSSITSLVGYWRMEDAASCTTLADSSSSNLPATISGTVTCGSAGGLPGQAGATSVVFNGTTGNASLGTAGETFFHNWDRTQQWTISFWIKPNAARVTQFTTETVFAKYDGLAADTGIRVALQYFGGHELVDVFMGNQNAPAFMNVYGSTDLLNGTWYKVDVSYTGNSLGSGVSMKVNSVPETPNISTNTLGTQTLINSTNPQIGAAGALQFCHCQIAQLAVYNTAVGATTTALGPSSVLDAGKPAFHYSLGLGHAPLATIYHPRVIYDDQVANDIDSISGQLIAENLHRRGEINLIGLIASNVNDRAADSAYAIAKQTMGMPQSFVGAWQGAYPTSGNSSLSNYSASISATYGANASRTTYTDAVQKYRSLLAAQPNASVEIISNGFAPTLEALMNSAANTGGDGLPSGATLLTQKVVRTVLSVGCYPTSASSCPAGNSPEYNAINGPSSSWANIIANWPTEIVMAGIELAGRSGTNIGNIYAGPQTQPANTTAINDAWFINNTTPNARTAWDEVTLWCAIRQAAGGCTYGGVRGTGQFAGLIAATASWAASATTITMPTNPGWVVPGMAVYDTTGAHAIGTVSTYVGTTLTLVAGASFASTGSTDSLTFSPFTNATGIAGANAWSGATPATGPAVSFFALSGANASFISQFNAQYTALPGPF
jgi:hypothetical protein